MCATPRRDFDELNMKESGEANEQNVLQRSYYLRRRLQY